MRPHSDEDFWANVTAYGAIAGLLAFGAVVTLLMFPYLLIVEVILPLVLVGGVYLGAGLVYVRRHRGRRRRGD